MLLEIGCGYGTDLVDFAKSGAYMTGVDISHSAVELAIKHLESRQVKGEVLQMNGETLTFEDNSFDCVIAFCTLSYTPNPQKMVKEICRVLKREGEAWIIVYHSHSWLNYISKLSKIKLPSDSAPVLNQYSPEQFKELLNCFSSSEITIDRFPVKTRLKPAALSRLFNIFFVPVFHIVPKKFVKNFGHHLIAKAIK